MRRRFAASLAGLALLATGGLAACDFPPEFAVPVSAPPQTPPDPRLLGDWYQADEGRTSSLLRISRREESELVVEVLWLLLSDMEPVWFRLDGFAAELDGVTYYSLQRVASQGYDYTADDEAPGWIVVAPVLVGTDLLLVCVLHGEAWQTDDAGELFDAAGLPHRRVRAREPEDDGQSRYLLVDTDAAGLQALLRDEAGLQPFRSYIGFHRYGGDTPELKALYERLEAHIDAEGCPIRGWAPGNK